MKKMILMTALCLGLCPLFTDAQDATKEINQEKAAAPITKFKALKNINQVKIEKDTIVFEKDKVYVIEFWATWCGPCRQVIPHISQIAKNNKNKLVVIGVSIDQNGKKAEQFAKNNKDMIYPVILDQGDIGKNYLEKYKQRGIPCAFIVKDGQVEWVGHPGGIEEPLNKFLK